MSLGPAFVLKPDVQKDIGVLGRQDLGRILDRIMSWQKPAEIDRGALNRTQR